MICDPYTNKTKVLSWPLERNIIVHNQSWNRVNSGFESSVDGMHPSGISVMADSIEA